MPERGPQDGWTDGPICERDASVDPSDIDLLWARDVRHAVEIKGRRDGRNQLGQRIYRRPGDILSKVHWPEIEDKREHGAWMPAWPTLTDEPSLLLADAGVKLIGPAPAAGRSSARPVHKMDWSEDLRFELQEVATNPLRRLPLGTRVLVVDATHEPEQLPLGFESPDAMVAQWRGREPSSFSSLVADIDDEGRINRKRLARLDSMMRVSPPLGAAGTRDLTVISGGAEPTHALAWNLTGSPQGKGYGLAYGRPGGKGTYGLFSFERGGPLHPGHPSSDRHKLGVTDEGESGNAGHLWYKALFYATEEFDGELDFELAPWRDGFETPYVSRVRLRWDLLRKQWRWEGYELWDQPTTGEGDDQGGPLDPQDVRPITTHCEFAGPGVAFKPQRTWQTGQDLRYTTSPAREDLERWRESPVVARLEAGGRWLDEEPVRNTSAAAGGWRYAERTGAGFLGLTAGERDVASYRKGAKVDENYTTSETGLALFETNLWLADEWDEALGPVSCWQLNRQADAELRLRALDTNGAHDPTVPFSIENFTTFRAGVNLGVTQIDSNASPYTVQRTDGVIFADTSGGAITITLPAGDDCTRWLRVANIGSNNLTLNRAGSDQLHASGTSRVLAAGEVADLVSDGNAPAIWAEFI